MKKKPSKLLASITAAAMAVMCAVVAVPGVEVSAAIANENGTEIAPGWAAGNYMVATNGDLTEPQWKKCYGISFDVTSNLSEVGKFNGAIGYTEEGSSFDSAYDNTDEVVNVTVSGKNATIKCLKDAPIDADASGYNSWTYLMLKHYWGVDGQDITVTGYNYLDSTGKTIKSVTVGAEAPKLSATEWTKTAEGTYAIQGNPAPSENPDYSKGSARPEKDFKIPVEDLLPAGKTVEDIESVSAKVEVVGGDADGAVGFNDTTAADPEKPWNSIAWNKSTDTIITVTTPDDFKNIVTQVNYLGFGVKVTVKYTVKCKGSTEPAPKPDDPTPDDPEVKDPENKTDVAVEADKDAIKGAVKLTDEEKTKEVTVQLKVETATLDDTAKTKVNEAAASKGLTVSDTALDIKLIKTVDSVSSEAELTKAISVTVAVPAALINNDSTKTREYFVIHYHGGDAPDILGGTFADDKSKFTFNVKGFSAFVLAYKDTKASEPSDGKTYTHTEKLTGDGWAAIEGENLPLSKLIGDLDPAKVKTITIEGENLVKVGYNGKAKDDWTDIEEVKDGKIVVDFSDVKTDENYYFQIGANAPATITWTATTEGGTTPVDPVDPTPKPVAKPVYSVTVNSGYAAVTGDRTEGSEMTVSVATGFAARVYNGNTLIATIYSEGKFTMPAANVVIIVTDESGAGMMAYTAPNSYIFTYDSQMKLIKTTRSKKGISGTGEMTVKLGAEYAGKTVTLYSGKNSTTNKITEAELDSKGCATFTVEGAKNYTLVVED